LIEKLLYNIFRSKEAVSYPEISDASEKALLAEAKETIDKVFGRSLRIRQVDAGSCNACEWECIALTNPVYDVQRFGIDFVASPRHADVLLVTGPVSVAMVEALKKTYDATPTPRLVIACGDCAKDGGVYRGSYAVTDGVHNIVPVDGYITGCPPTPASLIRGIVDIVAGRIK